MTIAELLGVAARDDCPRCGGKLKQSRLRSAKINRCQNGCGIWIDQIHLDRLAGKNRNRYEVENDLPARMTKRKPISAGQ